MSDIEFITVPVNKLFKSVGGKSKYKKEYCQMHKGEYPVYTGTIEQASSYIDTYDYDGENLSYTTRGANAGTVEIITGKYSVGNNRALLIPLEAKISLKYFMYVLEPFFLAGRNNFDTPAATWELVKNIDVKIPIKDGEYDYDMQEEIARRYGKLEKQRKKLIDYKNELIDSYVNISVDGYNHVEKPLNQLFNYVRGRSCTKKYCNGHKGKYPVWSANNIEPLAYVDFYDYEGRYISLSRNGIAGKITILDGRFTINEDRFILMPKVENIDYNFIKYTVEPILRSKKKGREGHGGQNEFTKLSFTILDRVKIRIPVNEDGSLDLIGQQEIAKKYDKLYKVKKGVCEKIEFLTSMNVSLFKE